MFGWTRLARRGQALRRARRRCSSGPDHDAEFQLGTQRLETHLLVPVSRSGLAIFQIHNVKERTDAILRRKRANEKREFALRTFSKHVCCGGKLLTAAVDG
jgi:hypothetical protein